MVVLSPELPPATAALAVKHSLTFPIVWDQGNAVAEAFGLAFTLPEDLRAVYLSFGNDLAKRNDDPSWRLPMPARFVIDAAGVIRYRYVGVVDEAVWRDVLQPLYRELLAAGGGA